MLNFFRCIFLSKKWFDFLKKILFVSKLKEKNAKNYLDVTSDETIERITDN